jgi:hypothetical protein
MRPRTRIQREKMVDSVFGPSKAKVYSQTTGPVSTQYVRTVFNIDANGRVTRGQHFPTSADDAPKPHPDAPKPVKTGSSTVFATTYGEHAAPKAHPDNLSLAWEKPE